MSEHQISKDQAEVILEKFSCTCGTEYEDGTWSDDTCPWTFMTDDEVKQWDHAFFVVYGHKP